MSIVPYVVGQPPPPVTSVFGRTGDVVGLESDISNLVSDLAAKALGPAAITMIADHYGTPLAANGVWTSTPFNALDPAVWGATPACWWDFQCVGSASMTAQLSCSATGQAGTWSAVNSAVASSSYAGKQAAFANGPVPPWAQWLQLVVTNGASAQTAPQLLLLTIRGISVP